MGYLKILDRDQDDEKIIAVAHDDPRFDHLNSLDDLPIHTKDEISEFFKTYKYLQNIKVEIKDWYSKEEAIKLIEKCREDYKS